MTLEKIDEQTVLWTYDKNVWEDEESVMARLDNATQAVKRLYGEDFTAGDPPLIEIGEVKLSPIDDKVVGHELRVTFHR